MAEILFNSVVSTKSAKFMTMDISNFYLMTLLKRPEYICMKLTDIPKETINKYGLQQKATPDGSIHIVANKEIYGLLQAGLLTNMRCLRNNSTRGGTNRASWCQGCGNTTGSRFSSLWSWTILVSNTLERSMRYISRKRSRNITKSLRTGQELDTLASLWTGTTSGDGCICLCQVMWQRHCSSSSTRNLNDGNMRPIPAHVSIARPRSSIQRKRRRLRLSMRMAKGSYSRYAASFCSWEEQLIRHCCARSAP